MIPTQDVINRLRSVPDNVWQDLITYNENVDFVEGQLKKDFKQNKGTGKRRSFGADFP